MTTTYRTVRSWSDLRQFGIDCLTGEACAYSMRLLCDVDARGEKLLAQFFGNVTLNADHWNSGSEEYPATKSVMLPREIFVPLAAFCLLQTGKAVVCEIDGVVFETDVRPHESHNARVYMRPTQPSREGRNVHQFTGRSE